MMSVLLSIPQTLRASTRSRIALQLEILALRHQLQVMQRTRPRRLRLATMDRWLWVVLSRVWTECRRALVIVKPETVIAWHRRGFRLWWTWRSRHRTGRPTVPPDVRSLIRTMARATRSGVAPRIHGELLKPGIDVSQATVAKYTGRRHQPPSQTWRTYLRNHVGQIVAADFFIVPTATYRLLFVLVLLPTIGGASATSRLRRIRRRRGPPSSCARPFRGTRLHDTCSMIAITPSIVWGRRRRQGGWRRSAPPRVRPGKKTTLHIALTGRVLFVLVVLSHHRRRIVHVNITDHPTATWSAQQLVDAFPDDSAPNWLHRDRDRIYGDVFQRRLAGMSIAEVVSAPASPWQHPYVERLIGSIRRECLNHVIVINEAHLRRVLTTYSRYYIGVEPSSASRKTRQITDRSLEHPPDRSSQSPKSVVSISAMSGAQRKAPCPVLPAPSGAFCQLRTTRGVSRFVIDGSVQRDVGSRQTRCGEVNAPNSHPAVGVHQQDGHVTVNPDTVFGEPPDTVDEDEGFRMLKHATTGVPASSRACAVIELAANSRSVRIFADHSLGIDPATTRH
jgi:hypothetical protein